MRIVVVLLASLLLLSGCARILQSGGQPIPGPTTTSTPSPGGTGTGLPGGGDFGDGPADEAVTDGPGVTG